MPIPTRIPNLFGNFDSRDLERPVVEIPQPDLLAQIQEVLQMYSDLANDIIGVLASRTTVVKEMFVFGSGGDHNGLLQLAAEYTNGLATRPSITGTVGVFDVGYPIRRFRDRAMWTPEYLLRAKLSDINEKTYDALIKDYNTLFRYVLDAVFKTNNYDFVDDAVIGQGFGTVNVKRLLNADGGNERVYLNGVPTNIGAMNNYKVSGTSTWTGGVFVTARDSLKALGLDNDIVFFVSKADADIIVTLPEFVPVNYEDTSDPNIIEYMSINDQNQYVPPPRALVKSPRAIGRIRNCGEVIVLPWMPDGYLFSMDRAAERPLVIRECDLSQLRGFRLVAQDGMSPELGGDKLIVNKMWERIFGVGVRNRANGCIVQITTNPTYTAPSFGI